MQIEVAAGLVELGTQQAIGGDACMQAPSMVLGPELVEQDAAPLQSVDRQQQADALAGGVEVRQYGDQLFDELGALRRGDRHLGLADEIADQLDGIVPARILEVDEGQSPLLEKSVVE